MTMRRMITAAAATLLLLGGWTIMTGQDAARAGRQDGAQLEHATLGGGCFWCLEAVFEEVKGVTDVVSGYAGGRTANPTYREVCSGRTGHAEVVRITFDPRVVGYGEILGVFFSIHDPTTLNRQGADVGTQYRSVIFYADEHQKELAERAIAEVNASGVWENRVVTEVVPFTEFFPAEDYHQDYYANNTAQGYCRVVINPKLKKFREQWAEKLKSSSEP
jgi:peptide-methionine (S)-S-oxide reductase